MVSRSDVDHIRRAFEEFDAAAMRVHGVEDYFGRFYSPDAVIEHVDSFPVPGTYVGLEGYRQWFDEAMGPYDDIRWELESVEAEGDHVVVLGRVFGHPHGEPVTLEVGMRLVYEMRDGLASRVRVHVRP